MGRASVLRVLLRFQLRAGARVALRAAAPLLGALAAAATLYGSPVVVLGPLATLLFPSQASASASFAALIVCAATCSALAPRVACGLGGWVRHLPITGLQLRRGAVAGMVMAATPLLALIFAAGLSTVPSHPKPTIIRLVALPIVAWGSALAGLRVRALARALGWAAAAISFHGTLWALVAATVMLVAAEHWAGAIQSSLSLLKRRHTLRWMAHGPRLWVVITLRALGARVLWCWVSSLFALGPLMLFLHNNELSQQQQLIAVRFATLIAAAFAMTAASETLVLRRPPWPWVRSLPWSATCRVVLDAAVLAVVALPAAVVAGFWGPAPLMAVTPATLVLCLRGAAAIRLAPQRVGGASGQLMIEGLLAAAAVAVLPQLAFAVPPLLIVLLRHAAACERSQSVSRWHELHHLAAGDPMSWSPS